MFRVRQRGQRGLRVRQQLTSRRGQREAAATALEQPLAQAVFEVLELELVENLGFVRTKSVGTIVPKGQTPTGSEGNRELFHRYIFNPELKAP